jgi:hypothetical protein
MAAVFVALTAALWILYGPTHLGYDASFALKWGDDLGSGALPRFDARPGPPTPHPLTNAIATLLSPLGKTAAPIALELVAIAWFAALALVCAQLGTRLFALPVGAFFALLVITQPRLLDEVMITATDVAFAALMVAALVLVAKHPRRGRAPLLLLAAAGLVRPEGWGFALLYGAYLVFIAKPRDRLALGALALVGPAVWMLVDLAITGNPLFSLQGTRELAAQLNRTTGLGPAVTTLPGRLETAIGQPMAWLGLLGWAVALWAFFERVWLPSLVIVLSIGGYLVLGLAELPLQPRYLTLPGIMLELFAAVLVFGWTRLERGRIRDTWMVASALPLALFLLSVPAQVRSLDEERTESGASHAAQRDLEQLVTSPAARRAFAECRPVHVHDFRVRPFVWYWAGIQPEATESDLVGEGERGSYVTPGRSRELPAEAARLGFYREEGSPPRRLLTPPRGARVVASTDHWRVDTIGCR